MKKTYKPVRLPTEAFEKEEHRKSEIEKRLKELTKKQIKIKMTDYLRVRASKPLFLYDDEIINLFNKKRGRVNLL